MFTKVWWRQPIRRWCSAQLDGGACAAIVQHIDDHFAVMSVRMFNKLCQI